MYLLDVNALLAWEHAASPHHSRFHDWAAKIAPKSLWTCAHTELGFLRVSMHVFEYNLAQAAKALERLKHESGGFIETAPSPRLASWASTASRTSDAYLHQIAKAHGLRLATFDLGIRGAGVVQIG
jgi:predicted nucleic acid-binding protein